MAEGRESSGNGALEWIKGLGLPIASFIASAAFFGIQMQQQEFQRKLNNIENGYQFYFEKRTALQTSADAVTETSLLQMLGSAFPNVYCNVRADMYSRATQAEGSTAPDGASPAPFREEDRTYLLSFLLANRTPQRAEYRTDFGSILPWAKEPTPQACNSDFDQQRAEVAPTAASGTSTSTATTTTPAPPAASDVVAAAPETTTGSLAGARPHDARISTRVPAQMQGARLPSRMLALRAQTYQVFFHLRQGSTHDVSIVDPVRATLAQANFRVMRGVRMVDGAFEPQVRYFGPEQQSTANDLVNVLNAQYQAEGLHFTAVAIGQQYPNMPPSNIEVWIP